MRAAFLGFRHFHLLQVYEAMERHDAFQIVAACEEDPEVRARLAREKKVKLTHARFDELLEGSDAELVVIGDVFSRRAGWAIRALRSGRHVLCDKPICTRLEELALLEQAVGNRVLWAVLELRDRGCLIRARELVQAGEIGQVQAVEFTGQHPLLAAERPRWYLDRQLHGGTINDVAIHAVDALEWITGRPVVEVAAARSWETGGSAGFRNAAQLMLVLDGGAGAIGDISYLAPDSFRYRLPQYWRFTFWGERGLIEAGANLPQVRVYREGAGAPAEIPPAEDRCGGYLQDLLAETASPESNLSRKLLSATRLCLLAQQAADRGLSG